MTIIARLRKCCASATAFAASAAMAVLPAAPAQAQGVSLIRDTEIEAVMQAYTDPLLEAAGLNRDSVGLYLIGHNEFNAFVTRGQNVFMHTGTIVIAETPNEIKAVMAHELAHIEGAHLVRFGDGTRGAMATMIATLGLGIVAAMAGAGAGGAAIMASAPQFATLDMLRYTRTQEAAADQAAITFLERTGQSPRGLVTTFERFRYQEVMSEARRYEYFRSHPLSSQRIDAMRRRWKPRPTGTWKTARRRSPNCAGFRPRSSASRWHPPRSSSAILKAIPVSKRAMPARSPISGKGVWNRPASGWRS
jgi:predicted Zn-dependent protease